MTKNKTAKWTYNLLVPLTKISTAMLLRQWLFHAFDNCKY